MNLQSLPAPRFVRRTSLGPNEYRKNFRQMDREVIDAVTSREADRVTPLMSKIYLRLVNAPAQYWEREGVLRFEAEMRDEERVGAWDALCEVLGVASATASKALRWLHQQGVIGYFAGKNGAGVRVFINRATSSIGSRAAGKKILEFTPASSLEARASADEAAFSDSFADSESVDTDLNSRAPKNVADNTGVAQLSTLTPRPEPATARSGGIRAAHGTTDLGSSDELTEALLGRLEPAVRAAAARAAAHEHERTREWLETRGLPKAARVAQREAFNVLRQHGLISAAAGTRGGGTATVGRGGSAEPVKPRALSPAEVRELAETCVAMLEVHAKPIDVTLADLSAEDGGVLLAEDVPKVRELALTLASEGEKEGHLARLH